MRFEHDSRETLQAFLTELLEKELTLGAGVPLKLNLRVLLVMVAYVRYNSRCRVVESTRRAAPDPVAPTRSARLVSYRIAIYIVFSFALS